VTIGLAAGALAGASESAVVVLATNGDSAAYGELVRRRQDAVRNLLRRLSRNAALADDLAQQTFIQGWKSISTLKSSAAFGAWLRKLTVNVWLQNIRSSGKQELPLDENALPVQASPTTINERMDLDAALATLQPESRLCVVLAYSEGMSHAEISSGLGLPLGTVKSHISRGSQRLRELLKIYGDP
jgi:RNA polymerase sigma factor (sigma-70 family)